MRARSLGQISTPPINTISNVPNDRTLAFTGRDGNTRPAAREGG
jgi:hypothetical protein